MRSLSLGGHSLWGFYSITYQLSQLMRTGYVYKPFFLYGDFCPFCIVLVVMVACAVLMVFNSETDGIVCVSLLRRRLMWAWGRGYVCVCVCVCVLRL